MKLKQNPRLKQRNNSKPTKNNSRLQKKKKEELPPEPIEYGIPQTHLEAKGGWVLCECYQYDKEADALRFRRGKEKEENERVAETRKKETSPTRKNILFGLYRLSVFWLLPCLCCTDSQTKQKMVDNHHLLSVFFWIVI